MTQKTLPGPSRARSEIMHRIVLGAIVLAGCGHPATHEECHEILTKMVAFELREKNIDDPEEIARKVAETRESKPELLDGCIGKRITDDAMRCAREATSTEAFDACLK